MGSGSAKQVGRFSEGLLLRLSDIAKTPCVGGCNLGTFVSVVQWCAIGDHRDSRSRSTAASKIEPLVPDQTTRRTARGYRLPSPYQMPFHTPTCDYSPGLAPAHNPHAAMASDS